MQDLPWAVSDQERRCVQKIVLDSEAGAACLRTLPQCSSSFLCLLWGGHTRAPPMSTPQPPDNNAFSSLPGNFYTEKQAGV